MKQIISITACLILLACSHKDVIPYTPYTPDISNINDPITTIKDTLEQQPPAYAYVPARVEVTDKFIKLYLVESGILSKFIGGGRIVPTILYYKNLGVPKLGRSMNPSIWHVEIYDKFGNDLYWVYTQEENEAKEFLNALYYMIKKVNVNQ